MPFVVDASVAAAWLLPDEADDVAQAAFARFPGDTALTPGLWWFEVRNIFIINERRGRIDESRTSQALALLSALPIHLDHNAGDAAVMALARRHRLTAYDAAYLELALREGIKLATLDQPLAHAARLEGVPVIGDEA